MTFTKNLDYKKSFLLAYPVMMSQLGHVMVGVADNIMVGKLGAVPLAASSLANVFFHLLLSVGIGISYGITPFVAQADGENNTTKSGAILKNGLFINTVVGVSILTIVLSISPLLKHINQPADVAEMAIPYLHLITFSMFPLMLFQTFRQFAEGLSLTKQAMVVVVLMNLLNILLNYIFIFGKLGFEPMGLNGAGVATLISRICMALMMWGYVYFWPRFKVYWDGFKKARISKLDSKNILKVGLASGAQFLFEVGAFGFAAIMVGWMGTNQLAAHQIAINLASITYMMASGLSAAATIRAGNQLGRKDIPALRKAIHSIFILVIIFMSVSAIIFILGKSFFPLLYIDNAEVTTIAGSLLIIAGLFQLADGVQVVGLGALRGIADVRIPTLVTFLAYWVLGLPIGAYLGFYLGFGPQGIWFGLLIGLAVAAVLLYFRFDLLTKRLRRGF